MSEKQLSNLLDQCRANTKRLLAKIAQLEDASDRTRHLSGDKGHQAKPEQVSQGLAHAIAGAVILPTIPVPTSMALISLLYLLAFKGDPRVQSVFRKVHRSRGLAVAVSILSIVVVAAIGWDWWRLHMPSSYRDAIAGTLSVDAEKQYSEGELVAGIAWEKGFIQTRLDLVNKAPVRLSNIELRLNLSGNAFGAVPITNVAGVNIDPISRIPFQNVEVTYFNPDGTVQKAIAPTPEQERAALNETLTNRYTVRVASWPSGDTVGFVFVGGQQRKAVIGGVLQQAQATVDVIPERVMMTGTYDVQHRDKTVQLAIDRPVRDPRRKDGEGAVPGGDRGIYIFPESMDIKP